MKKYTYLRCLSCGETLEGIEDYDEENPRSLYCLKCLDDDDQLKTFGEVLEITTCDVMKNSNIPYSKARVLAKERLVQNPAWEEFLDAD